MIIDAMDLLHLGRFDGFCLVSSDSDFTQLAARIRESGSIVFGFGEQKTPKPFVAACDKFIYIENLVSCTTSWLESLAGLEDLAGLGVRVGLWKKYSAVKILEMRKGWSNFKGVVMIKTFKVYGFEY